MYVRLTVPGGGFVARVQILPFTKLPKGITWGSRFFVLTDQLVVERDGTTYHVYEEDMNYFVPPDAAVSLVE